LTFISFIIQNYGILHFRERRKMKMAGFATLRRKFIRKRRCSKSCDHGRVIREFVSSWTHAETRSLLEEYEALATLKDLTIQAELARPPAATYKQDLSTLYDFKYCSDIDLIFRGTCFPVHRAILSSRSTQFRNILAKYPSYDAQIRIDPHDLNRPNTTVEMFSALLRFLYTGDVGPRDGDVDLACLRQMGDDIGVVNQLEQDLRYLLDTGDLADTVLVFSSENMVDMRRLSNNSEFGFRPKLELTCHKAILSARSPFFRNLIQRRSRSGEEHTERVLHVQSRLAAVNTNVQLIVMFLSMISIICFRIMLDDSVIPKRYAKVLLSAIYLDTVDLSLILRGSGCTSSAGSLGEVEALTNTGRSRPSPLEEVMELYQIGRFLELEIVTQGCEDLILEWLTLETLPAVLR
jgi:BTB/POZ domain-containing protein 7